MRCGEKIRQLRESAHLSQTDLANMLGVSLRTVQRYEKCERIPSADVLVHIGTIFNETSESMLSDEDLFINAAAKLGGRSALQAMELVNAVGGLFAGGDLTEEDKDAVMQAIMEAYWDAKARNAKKQG